MKILLTLVVAAAMAVSATADAATATIPGLRARDLVKHFGRLGMACSGPAKKGGQLTWTCTQRAGSSRYVVTILGTSPTELMSILGKATIRAQKPNPIAQSFLGYMAQIPYKGATPLKARLWARKHFGGGTTRINGVTFIVSGSPHLRQIEMKA